MKFKNLRLIFILELLSIPLVVFVFRVFSNEKKVAAFIATFIFIAIGVLAVKKLWQKSPLKSLTLWTALAHLFATSIPMFVMRLIHMEKDFNQIQIFGMPGPVFHIYAQKVYVLMIVATLIDLLRCWWSERRQKAERLRQNSGLTS